MILSDPKRDFPNDPEYWNWLAWNEMSGGISKETVIESENLQMQNGIQVNLAFTYVYAYNQMTKDGRNAGYCVAN
ncbi:hypothetical protein IGI04_001781 [Brassica rapa subsp. trilocularis]|uniref:Uncharacterized protein n=1 Tax=Brassica rapa subsp. trilocularis TaxID=1813537 RepID=A0ABQ7NTL7_BRACM|nr:hypothetical protein IGI04_001781 [Brassica rapa subsp. trilocularis]